MPWKFPSLFQEILPGRSHVSYSQAIKKSNGVLLWMLRYFNARSETEALLYAMQGAVDETAVTVVSRNWVEAHFMKGFALVVAFRGATGLRIDRAHCCGRRIDG
jgi:hypothetical protein